MIRAGLIINPRSHRNRLTGPRPIEVDGVLTATPEKREELKAALTEFARKGVDLLVIDGGDGTVREVLTEAPLCFGTQLPPLAVLPSGKTNALALALGAPRDWSLDAALARAARNKVRLQSALEILREGETEPSLRGFLFGAGAAVRATELAQRAHKLGAFNNVAVALAVGGGVRRTLFGHARAGWRAGEPMRLSLDGEPAQTRDMFLVLASTLERLPLGVRPFGKGTQGLRTLSVNAPPRLLLRALPAILMGRAPAWLERKGYRRTGGQSFHISLESGFVLDGEIYPGGNLTVRQGPALSFVVP